MIDYITSRALNLPLLDRLRTSSWLSWHSSRLFHNYTIGHSCTSVSSASHSAVLEYFVNLMMPDAVVISIPETSKKCSSRCLLDIIQPQATLNYTISISNQMNSYLKYNKNRHCKESESDENVIKATESGGRGLC